MTVANPASAAAVLARTGKLRAGINVSNPALAKPGDNGPSGITVDLSHRLAQALDVPLELVVCESAGATTEALRDGACDIAFMAVDPAREADFRFSDVYLTIEGVYAVRQESVFAGPDDLDAPEVTIVSTAGTAYPKFLERSLTAATLAQVPNGFDAFRDMSPDAVAGIRQAVESFAEGEGNLRIVLPAFMEIHQAIAIRRDLGPDVMACINEAVFTNA